MEKTSTQFLLSIQSIIFTPLLKKEPQAAYRPAQFLLIPFGCLHSKGRSAVL